MEKKTTSWFVAVVTPNTEKRSAERLTRLVTQWKSAQVIAPTEPITTYVPSQKEVRIQPSTSRRVEVERLLCPCYLFIECSDQLRYKIASEASFIHRFLMDRASTPPSGRNDFARIPHPQIPPASVPAARYASRPADSAVSRRSSKNPLTAPPP